ncbi:MAG: ATP-dependent 6-phosphofructokinase [Acidobacteriota bacterium]
MTRRPTLTQLQVERLGAPRFDTPFRGERFAQPGERVLWASTTTDLEASQAAGEEPASFEIAGARRRLFFDPRRVTCGVVSCGGLCPGINNVIRSLVLSLTHGYGVAPERILGFRYGFAGLADADPPPLRLDPEAVMQIHEEGGSLLGSSRGPQDVGRMVDRLETSGVSILFTIGGDGTQRGAAALCEEIDRRGLEIAVVGIPKTIDNDIRLIERSFGFATAVDEARRVIDGAHSEAWGAHHGIGMVKLMGRHSGFITAHATLASSDVNFCLVPEVPFSVEGLAAALEQRLRERRHAVVAVAEGAGQELMPSEGRRADASGNARLGDIGPFLKRELRRALEARGLRHTLKYIDPSYIVRSLPANALDAEYCLRLGQLAVHAAMAGRTRLLIGFWNRHFTHVPIDAAVRERKRLDPKGAVWQRVLEATGQPASMILTTRGDS